MKPPESRSRCFLLLGLSLTLLTVGIGYDYLYGTKLADFLVIIAGLFVGWVGLIYCLSHLSSWRE